MDPATLSIRVTIFGSFMFPIAGAGFGLYLAYRARNKARESGGVSGSEKTARTAIILGWAILGLSVVPLCLIFVSTGLNTVCSGFTGLCDALTDSLQNAVSGLGL